MNEIPKLQIRYRKRCRHPYNCSYQDGKRRCNRPVDCPWKDSTFLNTTRREDRLELVRRM